MSVAQAFLRSAQALAVGVELIEALFAHGRVTLFVADHVGARHALTPRVPLCLALGIHLAEPNAVLVALLDGSSVGASERGLLLTVRVTLDGELAHRSGGGLRGAAAVATLARLFLLHTTGCQRANQRENPGERGAF